MITAVSELQLAVLETLWRLDQASVNEVQRQIPYNRPLARTTVATVLSRMRDQGLVEEVQGSAPAAYRPLVSREDVRASMVGTLVDSAFQGSRMALVSHLLGESGVDAEDVNRIVELLRQTEEKRKGKNHVG